MLYVVQKIDIINKQTGKKIQVSTDQEHESFIIAHIIRTTYVHRLRKFLF
jgi:hypothetical protein